MCADVKRDIPVFDEVFMLEHLHLKRVECDRHGVFDKYEAIHNDDRSSLELYFNRVVDSVEVNIALADTLFRFEHEAYEHASCVNTGELIYLVCVFDHSEFTTVSYVETHPSVGADVFTTDKEFGSIGEDNLLEYARIRDFNDG